MDTGRALLTLYEAGYADHYRAEAQPHMDPNGCAMCRALIEAMLALRDAGLIEPSGARLR